MNRFILIVLLASVISFVGCEKKHAVTFKTPSGKTTTVSIE